MKRKSMVITALLIASCFTLPAVITAATYDDTVHRVQKRLQELGYNLGPPDGLWGGETKTAVKKFQQDNGLPASGEIDEATKNALLPEATMSGTIPQGALKPVSQKVAGKIPSFFVYEGSKVLILYDQSGGSINLTYKNGKWNINKSDIGDEIKPGKVKIAGRAKEGTDLNKLPRGANIGEGQFSYRTILVPGKEGKEFLKTMALAGKGGIGVIIDASFE